MRSNLIPVGIRLSREQIDGLTADGSKTGEAVRRAVDAYLAGPIPLVGSSQTAELLGVATGNLSKVAGLPEPLYDPARGGPSGGRLYDKAAIVALAERRRARAAA